MLDSEATGDAGVVPCASCVLAKTVHAAMLPVIQDLCVQALRLHQSGVECDHPEAEEAVMEILQCLHALITKPRVRGMQSFADLVFCGLVGSE